MLLLLYAVPICYAGYCLADTIFENPNMLLAQYALTGSAHVASLLP
jgi:hypothetical protein